MITAKKDKPMLASMNSFATRSQPDPLANMAKMTDKLSLVPAAWPTGVSALALAVEACQRCERAARNDESNRH